MPTLTTVDGHKFSYSAASIYAIADHDLSTDQAVTCIYGITNGTIKIFQSVDDFLANLETKSGFVKFTLLSGLPIWINAPAVKSIREPADGEYVSDVRSVVAVGSLNLALTNGIDDVTETIDAHGGKV